MEFLAYWELNENMPEQERLSIANKLMESGLFPPEGVTIFRWDSTPDLWGTLIFEADTAEQAQRTLNVWRSAGAGFFKFTKMAPSMPVQDVIPISANIQEALGSA
ncbi:MAG: hypothetical protein BZY75_01945 [SAR202 cluster bacterium Io17-Chloro-G7]|nr:MAG: hypothetical protein BZY75_01945 [SAR202 cluster bacterium Io17-Chloro-G7]